MTDRHLKEHVQNALDCELSVDQRDIGVSVDNGVVTLGGKASSSTERSTAERVALRVDGVKAVANDLQVRLPGTANPTDSEIARRRDGIQVDHSRAARPDLGVASRK
jgi:hypothetical protein